MVLADSVFAMRTVSLPEPGVKVALVATVAGVGAN